MTKKLNAKVLALAITLLMAVILIPLLSENTFAATKTKKYTVYSKEQFSLYLGGIGNIKKVTSSNKKVATVSRDKDFKWIANIKTKKAGKATITIRYKKHTFKAKLTVKKLNIKGSIVSRNGDYIIIKFKNYNPRTFEQFAYKYTLKNSVGETLQSGTVGGYGGIYSKSTKYGREIYIDYAIRDQVDLSKSSVTVTAATHAPGTAYKSASKYIKLKSKTTTDKAVQTTIKNSSKYDVTVIGEVKFYDDAGKLVCVQPLYEFLTKKSTQTDKHYSYSQNFAKYVVTYKSYYKK